MRSATHLVPVIDWATLAEKPDLVAGTLDSAGAFILGDAGLPAGLVADTRAQATEFFADQPEYKRAFESPQRWQFRGYRVATGSLDRQASTIDLCETFTIGPPDSPGLHAGQRLSPAEIGHFYAANIWPDRPAGLRDQLELLYQALSTTAASVARSLDRALLTEPGRLAAAMTGHVSELAVNYYPAAAGMAAPGQLRRGAHRDFTIFTVLIPDYAAGGLEFADRSGRWLSTEAKPGSVVVLLGELMPLIADRPVFAPLHRVAAPSADPSGGQSPGRDRVSFAFFVEPAPDYLIPVPGAGAGRREQHAGELVLDQIAGLVPAELRS